MPPQVFYLSVVLQASGATGWAAASASWGPAAVGLALFAGLALALRAGLLPRSCWDLWDVPAWTATLLFMLEPLAALVRWPLAQLAQGASPVHQCSAIDAMQRQGMPWQADDTPVLAVLQASAARDPGALASASLPAFLLPALATGLQVPPRCSFASTCGPQVCILQRRAGWLDAYWASGSRYAGSRACCT